MPDLRKIAWVGGYPAHYMCELHCRLEKLYPGRIRFFYVESNRTLRKQREYETAELPRSHELFTNRSRFRTFRLIKRLAGFAPDLIITAAHYPRPIWLAALFFIARGGKVCYWSDTNLHDILLRPRWWQSSKRTVFGFYLRRMYRLLYMGSRNRDFYVWAAGREHFNRKAVFVPYPHNHEKYLPVFERRAARSSAPAPFTVISIGRLVPYKRYDRLIDAMALLPEDILRHVACDIAGDGPLRESLVRRAQGSRAARCIRFRGPVSSDRIADFLQKGDAFILVSDVEPWGIVVNEAFSAGLPVIAPYWIGAAGDLVIDGVTGISLPGTDPAAIARAIERLYRDPARARELGSAGHDHIKRSGFDLEKAVENLGAVIEGTDTHVNFTARKGNPC